MSTQAKMHDEILKREIEIACPECFTTISGVFPPNFRCPHCDLAMLLDDDGFIVWHEGPEETCPECGHTFRSAGKHEPPTAFEHFDRKVRNFLDRVGSVFK